MKRLMMTAGALAIALSATLQAQGTDYTLPGGAGGGVTGSVAPFVPAAGGGGGGGGGGAGGTGGTMGAMIGGGVNTAVANLSAGTSVTTTLGGGPGGAPGITLTVTPGAAQSIAAVLTATSSGPVTALANALTASIGAGPATNLANALANLGQSTTMANFQSAIQAYNAAVNALAPGATPPPQLLAARAALQTIGNALPGRGR